MVTLPVPDFVSCNRLLTLPGESLSARAESDQRSEKGKPHTVSLFDPFPTAKFEDKHRLTADTVVFGNFR